MTIHELKTDPEPFHATWCGLKKFEVRKADRPYKVGDFIVLRETAHTGEEMSAGKPLNYTGRLVSAVIRYILTGKNYGLQEGFCVLGLDHFTNAIDKPLVK